MAPVSSPVAPGEVSPMRTVPDGIRRPDYVANGGIPSARELGVVDAAAAVRMRAAGRAARRVLERLRSEVHPGVTTDQLDAIAHDAYVHEGGYPSPLGYKGFPKSL